MSSNLKDSEPKEESKKPYLGPKSNRNSGNKSGRGNNHGNRNAGGRKQKRGNYEGGGKSSKNNFDRPTSKKTYDEIDWDYSIEQEIQQGNLKLRGRKAQVSINHLLDFSLPEHEKQPRHTKSKKKRFDDGEHIALHGDSFINANYKILVNDGFDYVEQKNDPNIPVPQDKIVRVVIPKGQNCPICLADEPIAPQMVTCGHIFCASCLVTFFSKEEKIKNKETGYEKVKNYKDCPLCGSIIRKKNVKSAIFQKDEHYKDFKNLPVYGKYLTFQLMCRPHHSILALPVEMGMDPIKVGDFPSVSFNELMPYAHIMKCDDSKAINLLQEDLEAIETQLEIDKALYNDDGKAANLAMEDINRQIIQIMTNQVEESSNVADVTQNLASFQLNNWKENVVEKYDDASAYFYYQTSFISSTKYFLSPLDVKILLTQYHHYSQCPPSLKLKVENVHFGTVVTEKMVRRYKYFGHLPLGTEIAQIDIDWRGNDAISKEVYNEFASELKQRYRKFNMKAQKEDKEKNLYQNRLEQEQANFYQRENGDISVYESNNSPISDTILDSLLSPGSFKKKSKVPRPKPNNNDPPIRSRTESTVWGTSISIVQNEQQYQEEKQFENMIWDRLHSKQDNSNSPESLTGSSTPTGSTNSKKGRKKKERLVLFSNGQSTL